jgi:atrial natriuretic peptide receptor A
MQILERVAAHENPSFRPIIGERDCPPDLLDLIQKCWADNPDERPSFANIRTIVSGMMK